MRGFDTRWAGVPAYINGITHDIWEGRNVAGLRRHYAPNILVRSPAGVVRGAGEDHAVVLAGAIDESIDLLSLPEDADSENIEAGFDNGILSMSIKLMGVEGEKLLDDEQSTQDFTGISAPYEPPEAPEVHLPTDQQTVDELVDRLVDALRRRGIVPS